MNKHGLFLCLTPMKNRSLLFAHLALFSVALIYGANYSIAKLVMDDQYIQPLGFILIRVTFGLIIFWIFHSIFIKEKVERKDFFRLAACGAFGVAINQLMFFSGLALTKPIHASLIMTTTPMLVLVISSILIKERITWLKVVGLILGAIGAILLISGGTQFHLGSDQVRGDIMIFINASSYGIYLVLVKRLMMKYNPLTVVKWVFTFGWFFVLPFGLGQLAEVNWSIFETSTWLSVLYVLIFTTVLAYFLNATALKTVRPSVAGSYIYLQPLLALSVALLLGKDHLTWQKMAFGLMILLGVFLISLGKSTQKQSN